MGVGVLADVEPGEIEPERRDQVLPGFDELPHQPRCAHRFQPGGEGVEVVGELGGGPVGGGRAVSLSVLLGQIAGRLQPPAKH